MSIIFNIGVYSQQWIQKTFILYCRYAKKNYSLLRDIM